jgi:LacI family transcriptional regulator
MAVTLKDIAEKTGVSPTTVSLVLNQKDDSRISASTREKILRAVKELGYQPKGMTQIAAPLPISPTIGLVISDIRNPFFTELASVIEDVASRFGYNIILCNTRENLKKEHEFLEVLWKRKIDGLIITPVDYKESDLQNFLKYKIPVVVVDRYLQDIETSVVLVDNIEGGYLAVEYLIRLGHKRIGIIKGRQNVTTGQERLQGYLKALEAHGLEIDESLMCDSLYTVEGGRQATRELLSLSPPPSAIFSSGGVPTVGALLELKQQGVKIPRDLSFIGFDDDRWVQLIDPPLTVVAQPVQEIGTEAAQLVIQMIQGWGTGEPQRIMLKPELIIRESCREVNT